MMEITGQEANLMLYLLDFALENTDRLSCRAQYGLTLFTEAQLQELRNRLFAAHEHE